MISSFVCRIVTTVMGFAWPAYKCFKDVESKSDLRGWCVYWITFALYTASERFLDNFLFWLPLYSEVKIGFVFFLARANGAAYVYQTLLLPLLDENQQWIDESVAHMKDWSRSHLQRHLTGASQYMQGKMFSLVGTVQAMQERYPVDPSPALRSMPVDVSITAPPRPAPAPSSPHRSRNPFSRR